MGGGGDQSDLLAYSRYLLQEVANSVTEKNLSEGRVYPRLKEIREISIKIAVKIGDECYRDGAAEMLPEPE